MTDMLTMATESSIASERRARLEAQAEVAKLRGVNEGLLQEILLEQQMRQQLELLLTETQEQCTLLDERLFQRRKGRQKAFLMKNEEEKGGFMKRLSSQGTMLVGGDSPKADPEKDEDIPYVNEEEYEDGPTPRGFPREAIVEMHCKLNAMQSELDKNRLRFGKVSQDLLVERHKIAATNATSFAASNWAQQCERHLAALDTLMRKVRLIGEDRGENEGQQQAIQNIILDQITVTDEITVAEKLRCENAELVRRVAELEEQVKQNKQQKIVSDEVMLRLSWENARVNNELKKAIRWQHIISFHKSK